MRVALFGATDLAPAGGVARPCWQRREPGSLREGGQVQLGDPQWPAGPGAGSQNVELVYGRPGRYMDLDPKGCRGRQAVSGDFTKAHLRPTFKAQTAGFFERPESRVRHLDGLVLRLDNYASSDAIESDFTAGGRVELRRADGNLVLVRYPDHQNGSRCRDLLVG